MDKNKGEGIVPQVCDMMRAAGINVGDVRMTRNPDRKNEVNLAITGSVPGKALAMMVEIASFGMNRDIEVAFCVAGQFMNGTNPELVKLPGSKNFCGPVKVDEIGNFRAILMGGKFDAAALKSGVEWFLEFVGCDLVKPRFEGVRFIEMSTLFDQGSVEYQEIFESHGYPRSVMVANSLVLRELPPEIFDDEGLMAISRYAGMAEATA